MAMREGGGIIQRLRLLIDRGAADRAVRDLDATGKRGGKALGHGVESGMSRALTTLKRQIATIFATRALIDFTKQMWTLGSTAGETASKFNTTFGRSAALLEKNVAEMSRMLGMTRTMGREMFATAGAITQGMGASQEASVEFSKQMVKLAGDLQSFHNVPVQETFNAIRSGITGETEPMKRFGIVVLDAEVKLRALQMTGKRSALELTNLEVAAARLDLMMRKAGPAVDDLGRTITSPANQARILSGQFQQIREDIAVSLMPAFQTLIEALGSQAGNWEALGKVMEWFVRVPAAAVMVSIYGILEAIGLLMQAQGEIAAFRLGVAQKADTSFLGRIGNVFTNMEFTTSQADQEKLFQQAMRMTLLGGQFRKAALPFGQTTKVLLGAAQGAGVALGGSGVVMPGAGGALDLIAGKVRRNNMADALNDLWWQYPTLSGHVQAAGRGMLGKSINTPRLGTPAGVASQQITEQMRAQSAMMDMLGIVESQSVSVAETMADVFTETFAGMIRGSQSVGEALLNMGKGFAGAIIGEMVKTWKARAVEAGASALGQLARGFAASAVGNMAAAGAHFTAAKMFALEAAKWGIAAGAGVALMGGGGSGSGGRGAAISGAGRGASVSSDATMQPIFNVYLDGVDPTNPAHVEIVGKTVQRAQDRGIVRMHPRKAGAR